MNYSHTQEMNADVFINSCEFHDANHLPSNGTEKIGMGTYVH